MYSVVQFVGLPFRWLWTSLGRLGLAERKIIEGLWRSPGRLCRAIWGRLEPLRRALRRVLAPVAQTLWRPLRALFRLIARPFRWPLAQLRGAVLWMAPLLWEELGRLGIALRISLRRLLTWVTAPVVIPARFVWQRALGPLLSPLWRWFTLSILVPGKAAISRWRARPGPGRAMVPKAAELARGKLASLRTSPVFWIRLTGFLAATNLILLYLLTHASVPSGQPVEAGPAEPPVAGSVAVLLPTADPLLAPSPVTPVPGSVPRIATGSVAFVARQDGNDDIYALTVGRNRAVRLTSHPADDRDPAWSPDGRRLAFASRRDGNWELNLLDVPTGFLARLTWQVAYDGNPSWAPDGQWLAFESYRDNNLDIYIIPVTGGDPVRLTSHPAPDYAPAWSPSGRHISFISWRSGSPEIYLFPLDDARDEAAFDVSRSPDVDEDHPCWDPEGHYLVYTGRSGSQSLVYAQPVANNLPSGDPVSIGQGREPTWVPGADSVLYVHDQGARHYLLASSVSGWGAAPEVYLSEFPLSSPAWTQAILPPAFASRETRASTRPLYLEAIANPAAEGPPYTLVALDEIQVGGPYLSDRVDDSFEALRRRVQEEAGWDFLASLDKMWESMDSVPPPELGQESWHVAGRAFDIKDKLTSGVRPLVEVVRELTGCSPAAEPCTGTQTWWRVYVRAVRQDGSQGEPLRTQPWNFQARYSGNTADYESGGRAKSTIPEGYYIDFTQLAADYGWERVPAGRTWRTYFPAILFWHLEKREGLTWEAAMGELFSAKELNPASRISAP